MREPRCRPKTFLGLLPHGSRFSVPSVPCYLTRSVSVSTGPSVRTNSPELSESWLLVPEALYVSPPCTSTGRVAPMLGQAPRHHPFRTSTNKSIQPTSHSHHHTGTGPRHDPFRTSTIYSIQSFMRFVILGSWPTLPITGLMTRMGFNLYFFV